MRTSLWLVSGAVIALVVIGVMSAPAARPIRRALCDLTQERDIPAARADAILSDEYDQNWLYPGCGTGREKQDAASRRFTRMAVAHPDVVEVLMEDADNEVRGVAVLHAGYFRVKGIEEKLAGIALNDDDPRLREYAVAALGRLGVRTDILNSALSDEAASVRFMALAALLARSERVNVSTREQIENDADKNVVYALSYFHDD
ncbi:MAG: HEAT repeat domain-containing protein [Fimbriimonadaceae bacterium]